MNRSIASVGLLALRLFVVMLLSMTTVAVVRPHIARAHSSACSLYAIDCTNPNNAQTQLGHSLSCAYYGVTKDTDTRNFGPSFVTVQGRYASGGAGATCNSAWARVSGWSCEDPTGCAPGNPVVWILRVTPSSHSLFDHPDLGTWSRQLRDCCGGWQASAKAGLYTANGNEIVRAFTDVY